jgi:myo-inositol 2-dehydrogenase/D-chiro-inositol 1-dehydrogenase
LSNTAGVQAAKPLYFFLERYTASYIAELKAFIEAVVCDTPVPVTGLDGRVPVVMGLAAWKSYREQRPVKLSEINA